MHRDWNIKSPLWDGDEFGRLTPPPEDILDMERGFFPFKPNVLGEQNCEAAIECESALLDLEYDLICPGEFDCYKSGPTLAELNETRSRSPLINPEMERLHMAAILTVGEESEKSCRSAPVQPRSHSVLEQQLRTQPSTSVSQEQIFPSRKNCSLQVLSTIERSEPIRVPGRDDRSQKPRLHAASSFPFSRDKKLSLDGYKTQNVSPQSQIVSPQFGNSFSVPSGGEFCTSSLTPTAIAAHIGTPRIQNDSVADEQVPKQNLETGNSVADETTNEQCDASEDEDYESEEELEEDAEEYSPFEKEQKTPARRKGRKSESEDMVPNPLKLMTIGQELDRLNKIISGLKPINELPQQCRGRSRREKNKLASRACRLKKKQQHEANKVKLHGLESEQENLQFIINGMKNEIVSRAMLPRKPPSLLNEKFKNMAKEAFSQQIAGRTTEFVGQVLHEVAKGNHTGGLELPAH